MSSTLLAEKPGSESAAASAVSGLMLACGRVILVHTHSRLVLVEWPQSKHVLVS